MTDAPLPVPQEGGSYVREKDGSLRRVERTIQPGEPGHGKPPPAVEPDFSDVTIGPRGMPAEKPRAKAKE